MSFNLPPPRADQPYFTVSALEGGGLTIPAYYFVDPCPEDIEKLPIPATPFLLRHSITKQNILLDLGIRKDYNNLPPAAAAEAKGFFSSLGAAEPQDVVDSLAKGGLKPSDISHIFFSHIHWDHVGNPALFPYSTFVIGDGAEEVLEKGYPHDPDSPFSSNLLPLDRTIVLRSSGPRWEPLGPFPRVLDYYSDGSLYVVEAPGHLRGHFNLLLRTSPDGGWMYLAGDTCHNWRILTGELGVAERTHPITGKPFCIHEDKKVAEEHIARVRSLLGNKRVRVAIAHDSVWYEENKGGPAFWPGAFESV